MLLAVSNYEEYGLDPRDKTLPKRLEAVEYLIRKHTNNNFQVRHARMYARSEGGVLMAEHMHIRPGDTVQVTVSDINAGLYTVVSAEGGVTTLDRPLYDDENRVTLVRYPPDVVRGAVGIVKYEAARPVEKAGIASEALSRHSVSYAALDGGTGAFKGYPESVTAFLRPYMEPWF